MKSLLKVLYIGLAFIVAIFVYIMGYNSNGYTHIQVLTSNAISNNDYAEVAKIHGGCFYSESIVTDNSDKFDLAVFPSATMSTYTYYKSDSLEAETTTEYLYENSYYIYIFHPTYEFNDLTTDTLFNKSAVRFNSANGSYDYLINATTTINTESYVERPLNTTQVALNSSRDAISNYASWEFFNITLTDTMIKGMQSSLNGDITSVTIVDSYGKDVATIDVALDFSQQFFTDVEPLSTEYNKFIVDYNKADQAGDKDAMEAAEKEFDVFYEGNDTTKGFKEKFFELNSNNTFRHDDDYLRPGKLVWQSIGMVVLLVVCAALLYILLFHFAFIKSIVFKDRSGDYRKGYGAYNKNKTSAINAKAEPVKSTNKSTKSNNNNKPAPVKAEKPAAPIVEEKSVVEAAPIEESTVEEPTKEVVEAAPIEAVEDNNTVEAQEEIKENIEE